MTVKKKTQANDCPAAGQIALLLGFFVHFSGVLSEPFRFFSRSEVRTGPEFVWLAETMKPYSQWLYINHGYFFFAPNPGPSHLIQCAFSPPDDVEAAEKSGPKRMVPDRTEHWPRLLYHRYFMLSEFYSNRFAPQQVTEELKKDTEFMQRWSFDRELYVQIQTSMVASLKRSTGNGSVELRRVERLLPDSQQVLREGWTLNDARLTNVLSETMIEETVAPPILELPSKPSEPTKK
ncbi:MAG: hypothetical protein NTY15_01710 [Planctomycetota bacterium]|jgi:hypothetical protein|nr:hypothetical protein [Planctomycetota bacterium]